MSTCIKLLEEVRRVRSSQNSSGFGGYEDVSIFSKTSASPPQSVHTDIHIDPAFAQNLAGALLQGAKGNSGLFENPAASVALASISEALARMLLESPTAQDQMARTTSMLQALYLVMESSNKAAVVWAAMALSQIALRRPDTAITM